MKTSPIFWTALAIGLAVSACKDKPADPPRAVKQYTIEQFYKNTQIGGGAWSPDESKLLVQSNESGIFNLYEINVADGKMTALTQSDSNSIFAIDYLPAASGATGLLYSADQGGNELSHIYYKSDTGVVDLTPGKEERAGFLGWTADKKAFFYQSNARNPQFMDLYKMNVADWKSTLVFQNDNGLDVTDVSWDEKTIAVMRSVTTSESELYLYDLASKKMTAIHDSVAPGQYWSANFSKDGKTFFYLTDAGKEFTYLAAFDVASGARKTLYEAKWDVMGSYLSENEKYRVISINEDGKNSLRVLENKTMQPVEFPEIKDGDILGLNISPSEKSMRLTVGTSKAPANLYYYSFETKELRKLTNTLSRELDENDLVSAEVVRYKSFDGLEIPAIYYKPLMASKDSLSPALVWVHGGPGGQSRVGYSAFIQYLVNHGYAVLAVNNRGSSGYGKTFFKLDNQNHGDKDLKDCIWGKKWLQSQDYIDSSKIGIVGGSYGGYMTMAAMTFTPGEFKVGVNLFGVTNWLRTLKSIPPYWESFKKALYDEMGDPTTADSVRLYNISPLFHAKNVKDPIMVLQGANDPRVLQVESDEIVAAVKANNVVAEYVIFPDEGHGFVKKENEIKAYGQVLTFLDKYLRKVEAAPVATK